ncbi:MAG: ATP-dependent helicase [Chloroflexi bacterium]|nr:ATP-dependent helicase [Chloroflexota bacterium]
MPEAPRLKLRREQAKIIEGYTHGKAGVAAVPGSGKTFTLAHLAARMIADRRLDFDRDQEVLVVTFTNSAVNSFQARIARILRDHYGLLPFVGYRVRTLHGLAHDIVRERPALVGLSDDFTILDEKSALEIQREIVAQCLPGWWDQLEGYITAEEGTNEKSARRAFEQEMPELVIRFIQRAKDMRQSPEALLAALEPIGTHRFDLVRFATQVYADYQRSLAYRGAVDFDDLVRLALEALDRDEGYLERLRARWPYILEDEAQDSSRLQEEMLTKLSGKQNWVRVGDPNQAINTTFTTADPAFLLNFLDKRKNRGVTEYALSVSGRSAGRIANLANELVRWTVEEHVSPDLRSAFNLRENKRTGVRRGIIRLTPKKDPQPNPPDSACFIHLEYQPDQKIAPEKELEMVAVGEDYALLGYLQEISALPEDQRPTIGVLVPENSRGFKLVELLRRYKIPYEELLRSTTATREAVTILRTVLEYLADPLDLKALKQIYWTLMSESRRALVNEDLELRQTLTKTFGRFQRLEDFLWPEADQSALDLGEIADEHSWLVEDLARFRQQVRRWLEAVSLPIDQLVLTIGQDLFTDLISVALTYKIAVLLRGMLQNYPDWRLPQFVEELRAIGSNERKFIGFDDAEAGYEPKPGVVTVATMHAAKGLEWDRVYLMAVSNYGFPSALPYDTYIGERWYVRDGLNLEAELVAQLEALLQKEPERAYVEGQATQRARIDYAAERLRLLYVGITRARRELIITWNIGRYSRDGQTNQPALPLVALSEYLKHQS